jgi:hypothetical protein
MGPISLIKIILITVIATGYFFILLFTLLPFIKSAFTLNPALYWFITGYFLFIPLFIAALWFVKSEGNNRMRPMLNALHIKPMSRKDGIYSISGLLLVFILTGTIFVVSSLLHHHYGFPIINTKPWFMEMVPISGIC